ncbi:MAG TPA: NADP-dependent succinic semialdehyde dehydrogenase [Acidimicrobiales bacterium]|nr:NADP-dependent succinic semialdehyde dehydrogenase [Acidimicrobiales bacterium]
MVIATVNPTTGIEERRFDPYGAVEVEHRLTRADEVFRSYRKTSYDERARWMTGAADLFDAEAPDTARILTTEMGKTFASAKAEVAKCASAMRWFAQHAPQLLADEEVDTRASDSRVVYQPLGPVLAVMPWNFPLWQVIRFAAPALMAGNVGLLKHASNVPQTALLIEETFKRAGFPEGAFQTLLVGSAEVAGIIEDPRVRAVTLTGSEGAGRSVAEAAGRALKKSVLELGGSDPFVVLPSADLTRAAEVGVQARVQNNGQSCIAAKRFIATTDVYDEFEARFVDLTSNLVVGDPMDPRTEVGPLALEQGRRDIESQVEDAREKGAEVLCGGKALDGPGWFYAPTVLAGITPEMRVATEEVFGPVALLHRAEDAEDALKMANDTVFGLGSSVWTEDPDERRRFVYGIEAGAVFVNAMVVSMPEMPFGGVKLSGYGRELSEHGIREFCNIKTVWVR